MRAALFVLPALLLAGCGRGADRAPGDVSPGEMQSLNDAAAMLDANSVNANAVDANQQDRDQ